MPGFALHSPLDVNRVPPPAVGSRVTLRTQAMEPPFTYVQAWGRSYAVTSVNTTGPCFHFARNLVPTPTGPSVNCSIETQSGFQRTSFPMSER